LQLSKSIHYIFTAKSTVKFNDDDNLDDSIGKAKMLAFITNYMYMRGKIRFSRSQL